MKFDIIPGLIFIVILLASCSNQNNSFPLNDRGAKYQIEKFGNGFALNYIKNQETRSVYISADTALPLEDYLGKNVVVQGKFIEKTDSNVQCIKAPCGPVIYTVLHIDNISER